VFADFIGALAGGVAGGVVLLLLAAIIIAACFCVGLNYKATKGEINKPFVLYVLTLFSPVLRLVLKFSHFYVDTVL